MRRLLPTLVALGLLLAACGGGDDEPGTGGSTTTTTTSTTATGGGALPGERIDIFPNEGAQLAVVGVAAGDTLAVRSGPGAEFDVLVALDPLTTGITATGHNRSVDGEIWSEVTVDDQTGWADSAFLLQPGPVTDITTELFATPADRPTAATMVELGNLVGGLRASEEPPSAVVVVDEPPVGDLGEVTVDVVGLPDDAVGGERLTIFAEPDPGDGFTVRTVEATALCRRGVTDDGLCV